MVSIATRIIFSLAVFVISGRLILALICKKGELDAGLFVKIALSFMIGLGVVPLQMFLYSLASVPFGVLSIALPWVIAFAACLAFAPARQKLFDAQGGRPGGAWAMPGLMEIICIVIIASQILYAFSYVTVLPVSGWDAWAIWFLKARAFFADRAVSAGFLSDAAYASSHPDYPLLVPLSVAWIYTAMGAPVETLAKLIYPLEFVSMLLVFHHAVKKATDKRNAILFSTLLSLTPIIMVHAAGFPVKVGTLYSGDFVGYADLALSVYILGAGAFFYLYAAQGRQTHLAAAALFLALGAWTKNEGMAFAAAGFVMIAVDALGKRRDGFMGILKCALILSVFILPWWFYKAHLGLGSEYAGRLSLPVIAANFQRLGPIFKSMAAIMFGNNGLFNFVWWGFFVSSALNWRVVFSKALFLPFLMVFVQLSVYVLIYVITSSDLQWLLGTSMDRLLLHLTPLSMLVTAINFDMLCNALSGKWRARSVR